VTLPWEHPGGELVTARLLLYTRERGALNRNMFNAHIWKPALRTVGVEPTRDNGMHALRHFYALVVWTRASRSRPGRSTSATPTRASPSARTRTCCRTASSAPGARSTVSSARTDRLTAWTRPRSPSERRSCRSTARRGHYFDI